MELAEQILDFGCRARRAAHSLGLLDPKQKNAALHSMADEILARSKTILAENEKDLAHARSRNLPDAMIDRLTLNDKRIKAMADGIRAVAALPDPVGEVIREWTQPNGIRISKVRVPIGVIG